MFEYITYMGCVRCGVINSLFKLTALFVMAIRTRIYETRQEHT